MDLVKSDALAAKDNYHMIPASNSQSPNKLDKDVDYENVETRRLSYAGKWVGPLKPNVEKMVDAGFVYVGPSDYVECYKCGIRLHRWKKEDDPREEHIHYMKNQMDKNNIKTECELYGKETIADCDKNTDTKDTNKDSGHY